MCAMGNNYDCLLIGWNARNPKAQEDLINSAIDNTPIHLEKPYSGTIAYLGSYLYRSNMSFDYVFSFRDDNEELIKKLKTNKYHSIGISTTHISSVDDIKNVVAVVKRYNSTAKVIVGGTFLYSRLLELSGVELQFFLRQINADFYADCYQGGGAVLTDLIKAIKNNTNFGEVTNIHYRQSNQYISSPKCNQETDLEDIICWDLFKDKIGSYVSINTSISCPYSCSFCSFPKLGGRYRTRSLESLEKELNSLKALGKNKVIFFIDDTFNVPRERFKDILQMLVRKEYGFKWHSYIRSQFLDKEIVELMVESGCDGVMLGIESGNQEMLDRMNKMTTIEKMFKGHSLLKENGITTTALFFIGFPGESIQTVKDTVEYINELKPDFYGVDPWFFNKTTPINNESEKYNIKGSYYNWSHETMDYTTANNLTQEIPLLIKKSLYNSLTYSSMYQLRARGMEWEKIKQIVAKINSCKYDAEYSTKISKILRR